MKRGEQVARKFHEIYERLAPEYGYATRKDTKQFDPDSPNGKLMIAVCTAIGGEIFRCNLCGGIVQFDGTAPKAGRHR